MAFLGSLGKSLGLDTNFGKGLVGGIAKSAAEGIREDRKRTQDNIDNLVVESYKGQVERKKEYDNMYKENKKLVEEIMTNMGGSEGMKAPLAPVAAQSLINQLGLEQAVTQSRDYKKNFIMHGQNPIEELELNKKLNGNSPVITLSALTKSTIAPISKVDMSQLGDSAKVGLMKLDFFGSKNVGEEIETRSSALMEAAGVDMKDTLGDKLPTAVKVKLDPLILGMQSNPAAEEVRLVTMLKNTNREEEPELYKRIQEKIDLTRAIVQEVTPKKGLSFSETRVARNELIGVVGEAFGVNTKTTGTVGNAFVSFNETKEKNLIAFKGVSYYMKELQKSRLSKSRDEQYNNYETILQAASQGKEVIGTYINDIYTVEIANKSVYDEDDLTKLAINREGSEGISKNKSQSGSGVKGVKERRAEEKKGLGDPKVTINRLIPELKKLRNDKADSRTISTTKARLIEAIGEEYGIKNYKEASEKLKELMGSGDYTEITS